MSAVQSRCEPNQSSKGTKKRINLLYFERILRGLGPAFLPMEQADVRFGGKNLTDTSLFSGSTTPPFFYMNEIKLLLSLGTMKYFSCTHFHFQYQSIAFHHPRHSAQTLSPSTGASDALQRNQRTPASSGSSDSIVILKKTFLSPYTLRIATTTASMKDASRIAMAMVVILMDIGQSLESPRKGSIRHRNPCMKHGSRLPTVRASLYLRTIVTLLRHQTFSA